MKACVLAACVGLFALVATPSADAAPRAVAVSYHDLDLATDDGADRLIERIERASRRSCRFARHTQSEWAGYKACRAETTLQTISRFGHPIVLARYERRRDSAVQLASR
jgi:UrcA family protein